MSLYHRIGNCFSLTRGSLALDNVVFSHGHIPVTIRDILSATEILSLDIEIRLLLSLFTWKISHFLVRKSGPSGGHQLEDVSYMGISSKYTILLRLLSRPLNQLGDEYCCCLIVQSSSSREANLCNLIWWTRSWRSTSTFMIMIDL